MNETVSIIVPVYNAEKYIVETIEHVAAQTYRDWELLLVLDGCRDASAQVIRAYQEARGEERLRVINMEENVGAARARNEGLRKASGRYIAYVDADDLWMPEKLELQLQYMKENQAAFVFTGYEFADGQGVGTGRVVHVPPRLTYRQALKNTTIFTSTVMFDTWRIPKEKLEMPDIKSEDTALWWKVLRQGYTARGWIRIWFCTAGPSVLSPPTSWKPSEGSGICTEKRRDCLSPTVCIISASGHGARW